MLKAIIGEDILLGLSERNLELLKKGMPIRFDATMLGCRGSIIIMYGETEQKIFDELKAEGLIHPDVKISGELDPHPQDEKRRKLFEALGKWSSEICRGDAELAPPQYLLDAIDAAMKKDPR